jgi:hypothetical protein
MIHSRDRRNPTMRYRMTAMVGTLALGLLTPALAPAQIPGVQVPSTGLSMPALPQKAQLLDQAKQMVTDLTAMKSSGTLNASQTGTVDKLLPQATSLSTELQKPQVDASRLTQLAQQLGDLQKQVGALKGMVK